MFVASYTMDTNRVQEVGVGGVGGCGLDQLSLHIPIKVDTCDWKREFY